MRLATIVAAVSCMGMVSCGSSDDSADQVSTVGDVADKPAAIVEQEPAATEIVKHAEKATEEVEAIVDQDVGTNTGESVYNKACIGCHLSGAGGAPKLRDRIAWADRIAKGADALVQSAIKGVPGTAMMARGACNSCSDDDIKAAVDYMISQSQ